MFLSASGHFFSLLRVISYSLSLEILCRLVVRRIRFRSAYPLLSAHFLPWFSAIFVRRSLIARIHLFIKMQIIIIKYNKLHCICIIYTQVTKHVLITTMPKQLVQQTLDGAATTSKKRNRYSTEETLHVIKWSGENSKNLYQTCKHLVLNSKTVIQWLQGAETISTIILHPTHHVSVVSVAVFALQS